ncbi:hypothetical protein F5B19DRAFT_492722 [Rostrohypoxylon terebratum]|nr:hypothetical protein F5B19DRAFT_492722 [Rostrohypoxylon terebratum]
MVAQPSQSYVLLEQLHGAPVTDDPDNSANSQFYEFNDEKSHSAEDGADSTNNTESVEKFQGVGIHTLPLKPIEKLGWIPITTFCLGPLISFIIVIFLAFLWKRSSSTVWLFITTSGWTPKLITLCAVVIRFVVDLMTGLSASMLAAQILETGSVHLEGLAQFSIMRATTPSLLSFILSFRQVGRKFEILFTLILAFLLATLMLALQFSSTILVSDLRSGPLVGLPYHESVDMISTNPVLVHRSFYLVLAWTCRPHDLPTFAEYRRLLRTKPNVDDTGYVFRSFLPSPKSVERLNISSFPGPSFVIDSRVSCQKPIITALDAVMAGPSANDPDSWYTLIGNISNSTGIDDLWFPANRSPEISFSCNHRMLPHYYPSPEQSMTDARDIGFELCPIQSSNHFIELPNEIDPDTIVVQKIEAAGNLRSQLYNYTVADQAPSRGPAFLIIASNWTLGNPENEAFTKLELELDNGFDDKASIKENLLFSL